MPKNTNPAECPQCGYSLVEANQFIGESDSISFCPQCQFPLMLIAGKYRLQRVIGQGGAGVVYLAHHIRLRRDPERVVKILGAELFRRPDMEERFEREVQITSSISMRNEHIVRVFDDFGEIPGVGHFYVMEYLVGRPLTYLLQEPKQLPPLPLCLHIFRQLCDAMDIAHRDQIVHRDLKPDNIFLIQRDEEPFFVKVLDFGIAKPTDPESIRITRLTKGFLGTPYYMSPEQFSDTELDSRSDIYSMGMLLYEMLTGRLPFFPKSARPSSLEIAMATSYNEPPAPEELRPDRKIPEAVSRAVLRALQKDPKERFSSTREFWEALRPTSESNPYDAKIHSAFEAKIELAPITEPIELTADDQWQTPISPDSIEMEAANTHEGIPLSSTRELEEKPLAPSELLVRLERSEKGEAFGEKREKNLGGELRVNQDGLEKTLPEGGLEQLLGDSSVAELANRQGEAKRNETNSVLSEFSLFTSVSLEELENELFGDFFSTPESTPENEESQEENAKPSEKESSKAQTQIEPNPLGVGSFLASQDVHCPETTEKTERPPELLEEIQKRNVEVQRRAIEEDSKSPSEPNVPSTLEHGSVLVEETSSEMEGIPLFQEGEPPNTSEESSRDEKDSSEISEESGAVDVRVEEGFSKESSESSSKSPFREATKVRPGFAGMSVQNPGYHSAPTAQLGGEKLIQTLGTTVPESFPGIIISSEGEAHQAGVLNPQSALREEGIEPSMQNSSSAPMTLLGNHRQELTPRTDSNELSPATGPLNENMGSPPAHFPEATRNDRNIPVASPKPVRTPTMTYGSRLELKSTSNDVKSDAVGASVSEPGSVALPDFHEPTSVTSMEEVRQMGLQTTPPPTQTPSGSAESIASGAGAPPSAQTPPPTSSLSPSHSAMSPSFLISAEDALFRAEPTQIVLTKDDERQEPSFSRREASIAAFPQLRGAEKDLEESLSLLQPQFKSDVLVVEPKAEELQRKQPQTSELGQEDLFHSSGRKGAQPGQTKGIANEEDSGIFGEDTALDLGAATASARAQTSFALEGEMRPVLGNGAKAMGAATSSLSESERKQLSQVFGERKKVPREMVKQMREYNQQRLHKNKQRARRAWFGLVFAFALLGFVYWYFRG